MQKIDLFVGPFFFIAALFVATAAQRAHATEIHITGFVFGCKTPDGKLLKPGRGDIGGVFYGDIEGEREACRQAVRNKIALCNANVNFQSNTRNERYASCLPVFREQAIECAAHFNAEISKCDIGGSAPNPPDGASHDPWSADGSVAHDPWSAAGSVAHDPWSADGGIAPDPGGSDGVTAGDPWAQQESVSGPSRQNEAVPAPDSTFADTEQDAHPGYDYDTGGRDGYDDSLAALELREEEQRQREEEQRLEEEQRREAERILQEDAEHRRRAAERREADRAERRLREASEQRLREAAERQQSRQRATEELIDVVNDGLRRISEARERMRGGQNSAPSAGGGSVVAPGGGRPCSRPRPEDKAVC